jgi:hypothetical protein
MYVFVCIHASNSVTKCCITENVFGNVSYIFSRAFLCIVPVVLPL